MEPHPDMRTAEQSARWEWWHARSRGIADLEGVIT
jgi:hypothetical protein